MGVSVWQLAYQWEDGDGRRDGGGERGEEVEHRHLDPRPDLSTASRTKSPSAPTKFSTRSKADEGTGEEEREAPTSAGARMSAEQRRRSAPKSDAAATSASGAAIGDGAAVRGGGEPSRHVVVVRGAGTGKWAGLSWASGSELV